MALFEKLKSIILRNRSKLRKACGGDNEPINSCIMGYYNQPSIKYKKYFVGSKFICRESLPLFPELHTLLIELSKRYKELDPIEYQHQKEEYDKIDDRFKIKDTIFTTITLNYNFQTKPHTDKGNYRQKSLIFFIGEFSGGQLVIDGVEYSLKANDCMIVDGSKVHYNLPIQGEKISIVAYIREGMSKCKKEVKIKNKMYLV